MSGCVSHVGASDSRTDSGSQTHWDSDKMVTDCISHTGGGDRGGP